MDYIFIFVDDQLREALKKLHEVRMMNETHEVLKK